jgi:hypothetical protein
MARQIAALRDDELRAIVDTAEYTDRRAADWISRRLIERRDKIARPTPNHRRGRWRLPFSAAIFGYESAGPARSDKSAGSAMPVWPKDKLKNRTAGFSLGHDWDPASRSRF